MVLCQAHSVILLLGLNYFGQSGYCSSEKLLLLYELKNATFVCMYNTITTHSLCILISNTFYYMSVANWQRITAMEKSGHLDGELQHFLRYELISPISVKSRQSTDRLQTKNEVYEPPELPAQVGSKWILLCARM